MTPPGTNTRTKRRRSSLGPPDVRVIKAIGHPLRWQTITPDEYGDLLRPHLGDHAADNVAAMYRALAAAPPAPMPDPAPAREALDWAPRDLAAWAARLPAFTRAMPAAAS